MTGEMDDSFASLPGALSAGLGHPCATMRTLSCCAQRLVRSYEALCSDSEVIAWSRNSDVAGSRYCPPLSVSEGVSYSCPR